MTVAQLFDTSSLRQQFLQAGYPVISVDTREAGQPAPAQEHDFPGDALGRAVPYGIMQASINHVYLG